VLVILGCATGEMALYFGHGFHDLDPSAHEVETPETLKNLGTFGVRASVGVDRDKEVDQAKSGEPIVSRRYTGPDARWQLHMPTVLADGSTSK
jgi:hypothetical protein